MEELQREITKAGYLTDPVTLSTIFLAARLHKPLLLEGPAGSGKTQLAYAVAAAETTVERLQCYEGVNEEKAIGKFDESLQRLCVELKAILIHRLGGDEEAIAWRGVFQRWPAIERTAT